MTKMGGGIMIHKLPALPYALNALEPYIDEQTMQIHHTKHHQTMLTNSIRRWKVMLT